MRLGILVFAAWLAGCGRVNFDPLGDPGDANRFNFEAGVQTYRDVVLADGPIYYWRFDETASPVRDIAGGGVTGLMSGNCSVNVPGLLTNDPSRAIHFGGMCQIDLGDNALFTQNGSWTFEMWFAWDGTNLTGSFQHLVTRESRQFAGPIDGYAVVVEEQFPQGGLFVERAIGTVAVDTIPTYTLNPGDIVYAVATYDGTMLALYAQGSLVMAAPDARALPSFSANAYIGYGLYASNPAINFFGGVIDEVAVYNRALAPAEIALHYDVGANGPR